MHPTPEEQLTAILRLVERASGDPELTADSQASLAEAARLIRRLERGWAKRLPFLTEDNRLAAELLADLVPLVPQLGADIEAATDSLPLSDEPAAHEANKRFQDLLGQAVHLLPADQAGDGGRARIVTHLRSRLAADPAVNRSTVERTPT